MSTVEKIQRPSRSCRPNPLFTQKGNGVTDIPTKAAAKYKSNKKAKKSKKDAN